MYALGNQAHDDIFRIVEFAKLIAFHFLTLGSSKVVHLHTKGASFNASQKHNESQYSESTRMVH